MRHEMKPQAMRKAGTTKAMNSQFTHVHSGCHPLRRTMTTSTTRAKRIHLIISAMGKIQ